MSIKNNNKNNFEDEILKNTVISNRGKGKAKSNYHIGKTIFFGLVSVGVGLFWGWLYALIPVALLIVFAIWDYKCKFKLLPGPKKILSCVMPCLSCLKDTKEISYPEMYKNITDKGKNMFD